MATTQRKKKSGAASKAAKDIEYGSEEADHPKFFKAHVDEVVEQFNQLVKLIQKVYSLPKGASLVYPSGAQLTRKDIRSFIASFGKALKEFKQYYRVGRRKRGKRGIRPEEFKGIYTPVVAGPALLNYFNTENFGYADPNNAASGALINQLPSLKGWGGAMRNGIHVLLYIAIYANGLQKDPADAQLVFPSQAMNTSFGRGAQAAIYQFAQAGTKRVKIPNSTGAPTFEVVQAGYGGEFNPEHFKMYFLPSISAVNIYTKPDLATANPQASQTLTTELAQLDATRNQQKAQYLATHPGAKESTIPPFAGPFPPQLGQLLNEHNIIKACAEAWSERNQPAKDARRAAKKVAGKRAGQ